MSLARGEIHNILPRFGSAEDTACLKSLFQQLGFTVTVAQNLTRNETLIKIIEFSDSLEHSEASMAIVCISSHGRLQFSLCNYHFQLNRTISVMLAKLFPPTVERWIWSKTYSGQLDLLHPADPEHVQEVQQ